MQLIEFKMWDGNRAYFNSNEILAIEKKSDKYVLLYTKSGDTFDLLEDYLEVVDRVSKL